MKIKIFNRELCVCALLDTNSLCAKSSAETGIRLKIKIFNRELCVCALLGTNSLCAKSSAETGITMASEFNEQNKKSGGAPQGFAPAESARAKADSLSASACHRTGKKACSSDQADTAPDQDSSTSKYVVEHDDRERKDGPGGD